MDKLPHELQSFIFSMLDAVSLGRACLVSKSWCSLASSKSLWDAHKNRLYVSKVHSESLKVFNDKGETVCSWPFLEGGTPYCFYWNGWIYGFTRENGYEEEHHVPGFLSKINIFSGKVVKCADMPTKRSKFCLLEVDGKIWALGGHEFDSYDLLAVIEEYDPHADAWSVSTKKLPEPMKGSAAKLGRFVYFVTPNFKVWRLNLDGGEEWQQMAPNLGKKGLSAALAGCSSCVVKDSLYVKLDKVVFRYNEKDDTWTEIASCPKLSTLWDQSPLFIWQDSLALITTKGLSTYDPEKNSWHPVWARDNRYRGLYAVCPASVSQEIN